MNFRTGDQFYSPRVRHAALVAELEDGTRMVYEVRAPIVMNFEQEYEEFGWWSPVCAMPNLLSQTLTVSGTFVGGRIWKGDMPTTSQGEIEAPRQEIEQG